MNKSEHRIQDEIRLALSQYGIVLRLNSGRFWQGKRVWSNEFNQYVLINLRAIRGCPEGTPDLQFLGENNNVAFIECKDHKGTTRDKQDKFLNIMYQYGIKAGIARSTEDAIKIIGGK
ncbi:MAG: VRR-NUC domain-containing protein [Clostridia bacterium]|nr:VRR-NUC domain-containing protein [Clostridia bacterium]